MKCCGAVAAGMLVDVICECPVVAGRVAVGASGRGAILGEVGEVMFGAELLGASYGKRKKKERKATITEVDARVAMHVYKVFVNCMCVNCSMPLHVLFNIT